LTTYVLCSLRLFKVKTERKTISAENLTENYQTQSDLKSKTIGHPVKFRLAHKHVPQSTRLCFSLACQSPLFFQHLFHTQKNKIPNSQLVCLRPVGILNNVMLNLNYLFQLFARPPLAFVLCRAEVKKILFYNILIIIKSVNPKISRIGRQKRNNDIFLI